MADPTARALADELRGICLQLQLSQRAMSRRLDLPPDVIRHMCSGHYAVTCKVLSAARRLANSSSSTAA